ncbi:MAG: hypothetical protein R8G66_09740 [Cytophagales bacterium]|nr:hypothetical protein [Cytophagales bacterium]
MNQFIQKFNQEAFKVGVLFFFLLQALSSHAQFSTDLNPHIQAEKPCQSIIYTALRKGYVSVKAEVQLIDGQLMASSSHTLEVSYLTPLFDRFRENDGHIYKDHSDMFYLFIKIKDNENRTRLALEQVLTNYQAMIAGSHWKTQANPVKVVLINPSPALIQSISEQASSLITLEGDYHSMDQRTSQYLMPITGVSYDHLDPKSLRATAKTLHRQGKKLRLYDVPNDQGLWKELIQSGVDFINVKQPSKGMLAQTNTNP